jgi:glutamate/aspartate transport system substrate-binding protein
MWASTSKALRIAAALLCAACAGVAAAQDAAGVEKLTGTLRKVKEAGAVTIGFRDASVPFSYVGPARTPIGYSIDLCLAIVEQMKAELGVDTLQVKYLSVNPQNRIALVVGGTVDLECGQTTNNAERRKSVAFSPIMFVSGTKLLVRRPVKIRSYRDLGKATVVVVEGTTNEAAIRAVNAKESLGINVTPVRDNDQALQALGGGKADAWAGDDVVLYAAAAESSNPAAFAVVGDFISYDPYGIMYRRDDPQLDGLVRRTFEDLAASRELARTYEQWFLRKLPSGRTLQISMSPQLESIFEALGQPTE